MKVAAMTMRSALLVLASLTVGSAGVAIAADAAIPATEAVVKPKIDIRKLFATNCSWCHQDYGMKAADGPKLAGTDLTEEQVIERISRGKSPMPGFRKTLSGDQIEALAKYIKGLKDPAN